MGKITTNITKRTIKGNLRNSTRRVKSLTLGNTRKLPRVNTVKSLPIMSRKVSKKINLDSERDPTFCKNSQKINKTRKSTKMLWKVLSKISRVANHSIVHNPNKYRDTCTDIDVWKYQIIRDGKLIRSDNPITTNKKYAKNKKLPQLISVTLFGSKKIYIDGLKGYIKSIKETGLFKNWDVRVYIASRRDEKNVDLCTDKNTQKILLNEGIELAHVDNHNPSGYSLEGTFWRFLPINEHCRLVMRDVDSSISAHELIALSEWINSGLIWHRIQLFCCFSPFLAGLFGVIGSPNRIPDLINKIKYYPYKKKIW